MTVASASKLFLSILSVVLAAPTVQANVVGTDAQNFNSISSGLDFVTVHSSETLKPGIINLGVFLNYAVNALPYYEGTNQSRLNFNDTLLGMDLNAGLGLTKNWDIGVSLPQILSQSVEDQTGSRGEFARTGATEIRLNTKYRLWGNERQGIALVASMGLNRIEDNPYVGDGGGPTTNLEVAADTTIDQIAYGVNLGYRIRQPGTRVSSSTFVEPLKNQFIASAAASYHVEPWNTKVIGEIFGGFPAEASDSFGERSNSSLEALLGAKHDVNTNLALHAGFGTGIIQGVASPDWRVYTGLNYAFGPIFEQKKSTGSDRPDYYLEQIDLPASEPTERFRTQAILFEFDSDNMVGNYEPALQELAEQLRKGFSQLVVEGHTDSIGAAEYNKKLSLKRANAIKRYLVSQSRIAESRIRTVGFGEEKPIGDNGNFQGRQQNRRVEFVISR